MAAPAKIARKSEGPPLRPLAKSSFSRATTDSWGRVQVYSDHSARAVLLPDGTTQNTYNLLSSLDADGPKAMHAIHGTGGKYFVMPGAKIFALVGANSATIGGYLQLSLMD